MSLIWAFLSGSTSNGGGGETPVKPVITLNGSSSVSITEEETYTELGATSTLGTVVISGTVENGVVGTYTVRYNASYNGVDADEVIRTVTITAVPFEAWQGFNIPVYDYPPDSVNVTSVTFE